jgi:hypothetical protein
MCSRSCETGIQAARKNLGLTAYMHHAIYDTMMHTILITFGMLYVTMGTLNVLVLDATDPRELHENWMRALLREFILWPWGIMSALYHIIKYGNTTCDSH